jgi:hypothetical protein
VRRTTSFYLLIAAWMITSCGPDIREVGLTGILAGTTLDESQVPLPGVDVTVEGDGRIVNVTSDAFGKFTIPDLRTSTYTFTFSKEGYGTNKLQGFPFVGGTSKTYITGLLPPLPDFKIDDIEAELVAINQQYIRINIYPTLDHEVTSDNYLEFNLRYFLHTKSDISTGRYTETGVQYPSPQPEGLELSIIVDRERYSGTDLYIVVYPTSPNSLGYTDLETGRKIFAGTGPEGSRVVKISLP